jgi:hypothetical protein
MSVVRYEKPPPAKRIPDFDRVLLKEEGSGILGFALTGFMKLQAEIAELGDFRLTDKQGERIDSLLAESDSLRLFARERIQRHQFGDITTAEFQQAYAEFCSDRGWQPLPNTLVERKSTDVMLEVWQVPKCHCVVREGKDYRGWKKVRFVPQAL